MFGSLRCGKRVKLTFVVLFATLIATRNVHVLRGISPKDSVELHTLQSSSTLLPTLNSTLVVEEADTGFENSRSESHSIDGHIELPRVIFHVGLPKTATSSIQCSLVEWSKEGKLKKHGIHVVETESCRQLEEESALRLRDYRAAFPNVTMKNKWIKGDFYSYASIVAGRSWIPACLKKYHSNSTCWSDNYSRYITNTYKNSDMTKFVISNENMGMALSELNPKQCGHIFDDMLTSLDNNFQIDIIFTQRNYWELLVSFFTFQWSKFGVKPRLTIWPGKGGVKIPTIMEYIMHHKPMDVLSMIQCLRYASDNNPRVHLKVIDYHDNTDILSNFLNMLSVDKIESYLLTGGNRSRVNVGTQSKISYDRVAVAAHKAGLINSKARSHVRNNLEIFYKKKGLDLQDFPHICPPLSFSKNLLDESMEIQKAAFPDQSQEDLEGELISRFESAINSTLFCDVNVTYIIEDCNRNNFFK